MFVLILRLNRLEMEVYNKGDGNLGLSIEEENEPFMFLTDSDFVVRYLFVPDRELPELSRSYYEFASQKILSE